MSNSNSKLSPKQSKPAKDLLVRGIDPIPEDWEIASTWDAMRALKRAITSAERLAAAADVAGDRHAARELRRITTACERALLKITGVFERKHIEPLAGRLTQALAAAVRS